MLIRNIQCIWNGTLCLDGRATAAMAYDTANGFLCGNFTGPSFNEWHKFAFAGKLSSILNMRPGDATILEYGDNTGHAVVSITVCEVS